MRLQSLHQLPQLPQLPLHLPNPPSLPRFPFTQLQLPRLLPLVLQQRLQLPLHKRWLALPAPLSPPRLPPLGRVLNLRDLVLQVGELPLQPRFLPVARLVHGGEIGAARTGAIFGHAEPAEVGVPELGLPASGGVVVAVGARAPSLSGRAHAVDLVVDHALLEGCAQGRRHGARDAVSFVPVVEDVQEGKGGVLADGLVGVGVHEVPGGADVRVRHVQTGVEGLESGEGEGARAGLVGGVDGFVFGDIGRGHVPVEIIFEAVAVGGGSGGRGEGLRGGVAEGGGGGN